MLIRRLLPLLFLAALPWGCGAPQEEEPVLFLPVLDGPGWGFMDKEGKTWVREPQYEAAEILVNGMARVVYGGLWGYVNDRGEEILEPSFDMVHRFSEGKGAVEIEGSWGYVDTSGSVVIPIKFSYARSFSESLAVASMDSLLGYINHDGEFVIDTVYVEAGDFREGAARVSEDGRMFGCLTKEGTLLGGRWFEDVHPPSDGLFAYKWGGVWGFMDKSGNVVVEPQYQYIQDFTDGRAVVGNAYKQEFGLVDTEGNMVVDIGEYTFIRPYQNGYAKVRRGGGWGFVDLEGREVIAPRFNVAYREFSDGRAAYRDTTGKWGFVDESGKVILEPRFEEALDYQQGVCMVKLGGKRGYINAKGEYIVEPSF